MSSSKPVILVYVQRPGLDAEKRLITTIGREKLVHHSGEFERFLAYWPVADESRREITLPEGSPSALVHVLAIIKAHRGREPLYIGMKNLSIPQKLAVWNTCHLLDIRPARAMELVGNNLGWVISHCKMTPEIMRTTYDCTFMWRNDENKDKTKIWHAMVHQYVWDLVHKKFTPDEEAALLAAYKDLPRLKEAIDAKFVELKPKNEQFQENRAENHRRRAIKRVKRAGERREAARARKIEEVAAGLRPMTDDLKDAVLNRERNPSGEYQGKGKRRQQ